jgi:nitric oxide reductase subunit C
MVSESFKYTTATLLLVSFLTYSSILYFHNPPSTHSGTSASEGKMLWQKHNCTACHQIYGLGGYLGPDLTNVYSKKGIQHIKAFLKTGSNTMPDYHLSDNEIESICDFLKVIDASGNSDPRLFIKNSNGTIQLIQ